MTWAFVPFVVTLALFAVFAGRAVRLARQLRDPDQLRSLLSDEVRAALREAGVDPDAITMQEIQESEELQRLVAADLRRALRSVVLGGLSPGRSASPGASLPRSSRLAGPTQGWDAGFSNRAGLPELPPPIDSPSRGGMGVALVVAVIVGLVALAILGLSP